MKAFEKRFPNDREWDWMGVPQDEELCNAMLETGWKAALEWCIKNIEDNIIGTDDGSWSQQQCRERIVEYIEKELEE